MGLATPGWEHTAGRVLREYLDVCRADKKGGCWWGLYMGANRKPKNDFLSVSWHSFRLATQLRYCIILPLVGIAFRYTCD
jgi:hypothetical protein